ncbi:MAG: hypothetical protein ABIX46_07510 [Burkholderiaceae bacterium]
MRILLPAFGTAAVLLTLAAATAQAKLPPVSDETKAKATEAAARSAWSDKVGAYKLCLVTDKIVARYHATAGATPAATPPAAPGCADPGPFVMTETPKPLEASGAHSPPATAVGAPSSKATEAEIKGGIKK